MNAQSKELTIAPSRLPMNKALADEYGIDAPQWRVLVEQIFPSAKSVESVLMAMAYCKSRNLDIFKKPVHIVPMWSSEKKQYVETVWPGISEIRTTAARTGEYAGIDEIKFGYDETRKFSGYSNKQNVEIELIFPQWAKATVYRLVKNQRCAFTAVVYWMETYASQGKGDLPNAMWKKRTRGQLAKCAEVAAIRMAFPEEVGSDYAAEEMEGQSLIVNHDAQERVNQKSLTPPPPPPANPAKEDDDSASEQTADGENELTPEDVIIEAATQFENCETGEELEKVWGNYQHYLDRFEEPFPTKFNSIYDAALQRVEPNTLAAG